jgi:hypothetical protein
VRLALGSARLRPLLLFYWLPPAFTVAPEALAAPYVAQLGGNPAAVGLLLAAAAAGSVAGMLTAGTWLSPPRRLRFMVPLASWTFVPLLGFAARPGLIPALALLVLSGLGWAYSIGLDQRLLEATPDHLRGRTLSLATSGIMLANGLGFAAAGAAAEFASPQAVIVASGLAGLLVVTLLARPITANIRHEAWHAEADGNRTRLSRVAAHTGFEDRGAHQDPDTSGGHSRLRRMVPGCRNYPGRSGWS